LRPYTATSTSNNDIIMVAVKLLTIDTRVCPTNAINVRDVSNEIRKRRLNIVIVLHVQLLVSYSKSFRTATADFQFLLLPNAR
jgi:hypothetical protein